MLERSHDFCFVQQILPSVAVGAGLENFDSHQLLVFIVSVGLLSVRRDALQLT